MPSFDFAVRSRKSLNSVVIVASLIGLGVAVATGEDAPKEGPILKLEFMNTKAETKIIGGSEFNCQVSITGRPGANIPKKYMYTFETTREGKIALAGQFIGETKHERDNISTCAVQLKAPRGAGEYTLRVTALELGLRDNTPEEKVQASIKVQVVEP